MQPLTRRAWLRGALATLALLAARTARANDGGGSTFHRIYDDEELRERFFPFLVNVFHLVPAEAFHELITQAVAAHATDDAIYAAIAAGLPGITPFASTLTHAIPALRVQKSVLGDQTAALVGAGAEVNGYVEIGTFGDYIEPVRKRLALSGPVTLLSDAPQTWNPAEMVRRGALRPNASFVPMGDYDPVTPEVLPDASADLITSFIGFHHAPLDRLDPFVESLVRVLRPGGRLIVREHDVQDPTDDTLVALAHDVFNVGTELGWQENQAQLRHFRSVASWTAHLEAFGLRRDEGHELQEGDPTDNALIAFTKA